MEKIKYRVVFNAEAEGFVIVEDGGVASWHYSDNGYILIEYCQSRITENTTYDTMWDELADSKQYCNEFPEGTSNEVLIADALEWLVCEYDIEDFEVDETIFPNIQTKQP